MPNVGFFYKIKLYIFLKQRNSLSARFFGASLSFLVIKLANDLKYNNHKYN